MIADGRVSHNPIPLREHLKSPDGVVAPLVLNPLMAKFAEGAGFHTGYLGGGALGYLNCGTEANLSLTTMIQAGIEIRAHSQIGLILDGTCGWGDAVHVHNTVHLAEAAGFCAIEIEDQVLPKRIHHHIGVEHIVPADIAVSKIEEAVAARRGRDFLIIARTNAVRVQNLDEALQRGEAFHRVGADVLLFMTNDPKELRILAERMPHPLMFILPPGGLPNASMPIPELLQLGYKLIVDSGTPFFAMTHAMRQCYPALKAGQCDPTIGATAPDEERYVQKAIDLERLIEIERRTTER